MADRVEVHERNDSAPVTTDSGAGWFVAVLLILLLLVALFVYYRPTDTADTTRDAQDRTQPVNLDINTDTQPAPTEEQPPPTEQQLAQ